MVNNEVIGEEGFLKLYRVINTNIFYLTINYSIDDPKSKNTLLFFDLDNTLEEIKINAAMNLSTFIKKYKDILFYLTENGEYLETHRLMNYLSYLKYLLENRQHFYINEYEFLIPDSFLEAHNFKPDLVRISKQKRHEDIFLTIDETLDFLIENYTFENDLKCKDIFKLGNKKTFLNEQKFLTPIFEYTKGNKLTKQDLNRLNFKRKQRNIIHCQKCFEEPILLNEFIYENRCKLDITSYQIAIPINGDILNNSNDILKTILDELYLPYYTNSSNMVLFSILYRNLKLLKTKHIIVHSLKSKTLLEDSLVLTLINCFNFLLNINFLFTDLVYIKSEI